MHGGLSADLTSFNRLNRVNRKREPGAEDMLLDLLWADPAEEDDARGNYFSINNERNCSVFFGEKPVKYIIKRENLIRIVRAH